MDGDEDGLRVIEFPYPIRWRPAMYVGPLEGGEVLGNVIHGSVVIDEQALEEHLTRISRLYPRLDVTWKGRDMPGSAPK